jgi:hypothetical protein
MTKNPRLHRSEKLSTVLPVKIYPSLKKWVQKRYGNALAFVRSLIEQAKLKDEGRE